MTYRADTLKLPQGVQWKRVVDGVREIMQFEIFSDHFMCRFDTVINGRQYHHIEYSRHDDPNVIVSWDKGDGMIGRGRKTAHELFQNIDHSTLLCGSKH